MISPTKSPQPEFELTKYRYLIVFLYLLSDLALVLPGTCFMPIANQISQIYDVTPLQVNSLSIINAAIPPLVTFLANKVIDERGLGTSVKLGVYLNLIGAWVRIFINSNYGSVYGAAVLGGLATSFVCNGKSKVAAEWFQLESATIVTTVISIVTQVLSIVGFIMPGIWFMGYQLEIDGVQKGKDILFNLILIQNIIVSVISLLVLIFFNNKPEKPPCYIATVARENYLSSLKILIRDKNYLLLFFIQGLAIGAFSGFASSSSYMTEYYGFNSQDNSILLVVMPFSGILGAGIAAYTLKKYRKFKFQLLIYLVSSICSMIFFFLILETRNVWAGAAGTFMMGFTVIPIIPNLAEFSCEVVFPVGEGSAVGFLYMSSSIFSGIFIAILSSIITGKSQTENYIGLLIVCLSFGLGIVLTCFIQEKFKRLEANQKQAMEQSNSKNKPLTSQEQCLNINTTDQSIEINNLNKT